MQCIPGIYSFPGNACTKPALVVAAVGVNTCILRVFIPGKPCLGDKGRAQYAGISNTVLRPLCARG